MSFRCDSTVLNNTDNKFRKFTAEILELWFHMATAKPVMPQYPAKLKFIGVYQWVISLFKIYSNNRNQSSNLKNSTSVEGAVKRVVV